MPSVSIGDADIYYEDKGEGPPLVLVPGLAGSGAFFISQVSEFSKSFRTIVHDHRGAGRSTHSRIHYSVEQMGDDTLRLWTRSASTARISSAIRPAALS